MATNVDRLRSALSYLDPNMGRDDWVTVAMGIKSSLGEEGFSTFDDWSKRGDSYNVADTRDTWRSINRTGGVTEASVFYKARAMGWRDDGTRHEPTPEEQEARRRKAEKAEAAKARLRARAAGKAAGLWEAAKPAPADNPYLTRKGVAPVATLREIPAAEAAKVLGYPPESRVGPLDGRLLVVPVKIGDEIRAVELIDGDGRKHALAGGKKSGGCWSTDPPPDGDGAGITLLIGEGVATVLSAQEATGHLAVATLTSGNLVAVAREMRGRYPAAKLVILADLIKATGEQDPHAEEAARAVGGTLVVPRFSEPRDPSHTDLNDFAAVCGMEAVRDLIDKAEPPGQEADQDQASEDPIPPLSKRPCFRVFDEWLKDPKTRPGVWFFGASQPKKAEEPPILTQQWVCSPLYIDAVTFDGQSNNFGRLLRFKNTIGTWRQWGMPMEMLRGFGEELRGALLAMGVEIDPQSKLLGQYLQSVHPKRRVHCALQVGWCGGSFVLPDEVVGPGASGVIFQSGERRHDEYTRAGTLEGWQSEIAARLSATLFWYRRYRRPSPGPC